MFGKHGYVRGALPVCLLLVLSLAAPILADYCGDVNKDEAINILDIIELINYKYKAGPEPVPKVIGDVDHSGDIDILDIVYLINFKYKGGPEPDCFVYEYTTSMGGCLGGTKGTPDRTIETFQSGEFDCMDEADGDHEMYVEMIEGDLHVFHDNAYYNCCLEYRVEFVVDGDNIYAYEYDDGDPCYCLCYFNLESVLYGLPAHQYSSYTVTLIGIEGEIVGTDIVTPHDFGFMALYVNENDLTILHINAWYNCCIDYQIGYSIMGNCINIFEYDVGMPCDCMCFYDLQSAIYDIPSGQYWVTLFGIEGDTVGHKSIEIGEVAELTGFTQSGCLSASRNDISYDYLDGNLTMLHSDAFFNCGAEGKIIIEFEQVGNILKFYERNTSTTPVYCMCYFELSAVVSGLIPGTYIAEIYQQAYPESPIELYDRRDIVLE